MLTARDRSIASSTTRPRSAGKFLYIGEERFLIKGVTYGTFAPDEKGTQFPSPERVADDFAMMAACGINTVRTYTLPRVDMLDEASRCGLRVMVGMPWTQHVAFLGNRTLTREIRQNVIADVRRLANHPAVLMFALGNEIPPAVVRWHGRAAIEQFLGEMYDAGKSVAPESLFTYVNFPPTEYLDLPFLDVCAFNVYLHGEAPLRAYVTKLQHLAGNRPLLLAELGADSIRNGQIGQAGLTAMQLSAAFQEGACGAIAFAWTDEWWRGGFTVEDWAFGLVDTQRQPKPAYDAVERVFAEAPFPPEVRKHWPKVSVVVCAYNAADTIEDCLTALERQDYPDYEIIVVNDGSRDATADIARRYSQVRVIDITNGGLSAARNVGLGHATGEIVAYTDADVRADRHWLSYLVQPFLASDVVGSGGPNVVPPEDPWMAQCVARAPGAPTHVLLDDRTAEHVPGCNMAFRRDVLLDIGGFNPVYLRAGDDVDICWRVQARGWKIGFAPAALVWHHHRTTVGAYWRQQAGYGEGEQWLMPHHPDRFQDGHAVWRGHIYSPLPFVRALSQAHINTGPWGSAPFPSVYQRDAYPFSFMPHKVWWQAVAAVMALLGPLVSFLAHRELGLLILGTGVLGLLVTIIRCAAFAIQSDIDALPPIGRLSPLASRFVYRATIGWLHLLQPLARAFGRLSGLLEAVEAPPSEHRLPERRRPSWRELLQAPAMLLGLRFERQFWSETWVESEKFLTATLDRLRQARGLGYIEVDDGWQQARDISVRTGMLGWLDLRVLLEDHGSGKRFARLAMRLRPSGFGLAGVIALVALFAGSAVAGISLGISSSVAVPAAIGLAGIWMWRTAATVTKVEQAVAQAAWSCDLLPVNGERKRTPPAKAPDATRPGRLAARP